MTRKNRKGVSLLELAIFAVVSLVPLGIVWNVMVTSSRQSAKVSSRLETLEAMQLLWDLLRDDLRQACRDGRQGPKVRAEGEKGVPSRELSVLKFASYGYDAKPGELYADPGETQWVRAEAVTYRFDEATGRLLRNGRELGALRMADATFAVANGSLKVELTPAGDSETVRFEIGLPGRGGALAYGGWNPNWFDQEPRVGK